MSTIEIFNDTIKKFVKQLARVCPDSIITQNIDHIDDLLRKEPKFLIDIYVMHVLIDEDAIKKGDDKYFLEKSYDGIVGDKSEMIKNVLDLKNMWKKLTDKNKKVVIAYMSALCDLANAYVLSSGLLN